MNGQSFCRATTDSLATLPFASLKRRLRYLRNGEAVNLLVLPTTFGWLWSRSDAAVNWPLRVAALSILLYVLAQGSLYWHFKLRAVSTRAGLPPSFALLFRRFRRSNIVVIAGTLAVTTAAVLSGWATVLDAVWVVGLVGFAAVEHVNYYVYQLAGSPMRWLRSHRRIPALAADLAEQST